MTDAAGARVHVVAGATRAVAGADEKRARGGGEVVPWSLREGDLESVLESVAVKENKENRGWPVVSVGSE